MPYVRCKIWFYTASGLFFIFFSLTNCVQNPFFAGTAYRSGGRPPLVSIAAEYMGGDDDERDIKYRHTGHTGHTGQLKTG
jgi:hypothetical protein